ALGCARVFSSNCHFPGLAQESPQPVRPVPYPVYRPRAEWESFLKELYTGWGDSWANPGK
ncbi:MAG: hypothetical protein AAFY60_20040, partial [Myxococcota bacterium]